MASTPVPPSRLSPLVSSTTQAPVMWCCRPQKTGAPGVDPLLSLPPPYFKTLDETQNARLCGCAFLGQSVIALDYINLTSQDIAPSNVPCIKATQTLTTNEHISHLYPSAPKTHLMPGDNNHIPGPSDLLALHVEGRALRAGFWSLCPCQRTFP